MSNDSDRIAQAAALLVSARRGAARIAGLPEGCRPRSVAEAHAIQDAVTAALGNAVGGYKANVPAGVGSEAVRGPIYAATVRASPARVPAVEVPQCGVEGEIAFRFTRDLPPRPAPYSREEVASAVDALAAIEVVTSRFANSETASVLEKLADGISNGGFVHGVPVADWRKLDLGRLKVVLSVNDAVALDQTGGHPTGDPLGIAVALVEMMRSADGVKAGQFVTCGSCTGLRYLKPGDRCRVEFDGLGSAEVAFV